MADVKIAVLNNSSVVSDDEVAALTKVLQIQVTRDLAPAWGCPADLRFVPRGQAADPAEWWLGIFDDADQAGVLGYHDMTDDGLPFSKAFARTAMNYQDSWTATVSHELLEMLVDPNVNLTVFDTGPFGARLYSYEVCDACEADQFGYKIDDVLVSDFVLPSWFESFREQGSTQFDFKGHIQAPFELLPGGYIGVNDIVSGWGWWQMTPPGEANARALPPLGSRRLRRTIPPERRMRSNAAGKGGMERKR